MMKLKILNLDIYKCTELKKLSEKIDLEWEVQSLIVSNTHLKIILKKFYKKNELKKGDLVKLISNILEVKNLLSDLKLDSLEGFFSKLRNISKEYFQLERMKNLDIFYDTILVYYKNANILNSLNFLIGKILESTPNLNNEMSNKTSLLLQLRDTDKNIVDFFSEKLLLNVNRYLVALFDFEMDFHIGRSTELFFDIIKNIFCNYIKIVIQNNSLELNKLLLKLFKENINNLEDKIEIYKNIINVYINFNYKFSLVTDLWFYNILLELGEIKKENREWNSFNETQKLLFKKWFFREKLEDLFSRNVRDPERAEFWKEYAHCIVDIKFYENIAEAIVMEFQNHTVVEFGKKGNAAYVYPRTILSISKVNGYLNLHSNTTIRDTKLKVQAGAIRLKSTNVKAGWNHPNNWQETFKLRLKQLGYF
ncbi:MAG: hypothetical protein ACRDAQ_10235 [Cetobacterium sp.]